MGQVGVNKLSVDKITNCNKIKYVGNGGTAR
jgi:hypothetical protein